MSEPAYYTQDLRTVSAIKQHIHWEGRLAVSKFDWMVDRIVRGVMYKHCTLKEWNNIMEY